MHLDIAYLSNCIEKKSTNLKHAKTTHNLKRRCSNINLHVTADALIIRLCFTFGYGSNVGRSLPPFSGELN
jgi:hypothetical protein